MNPRLLEIKEERQALHQRLVALDQEETEILTRTKRTKKSVELKFGKNVIRWEGGEMKIRGKGYTFVTALYGADKMRLTEGTLGKYVWGKNREPKHKTFTEYVRGLALKLEKAKFPYHLLPAMSQGKTRQTNEIRNNKPIKIYEPPEIIGVKLRPR